MQTNLSTMNGGYTCGELYDVPDAIGAQWCRNGLATKSAVPPRAVRDILSRLETDRPDTPHLFLPFCGEFGHLILSHIRLVQFHQAKTKIVCAQHGEESLYPDATAFDYEWVNPIPDAQRAGTIRPFDWPEMKWSAITARHPNAIPVPSGLSITQEKITLYPERRIPFTPKRRGITADVCLGVRVRDFCTERNFPAQHWQAIADALTEAGITFGVVGKRPTSFDLDGQAWHTEGDCDAAIEAVENCRLWVGTDTGTSHLASTIGGRPMIIFREDEASNFVDLMKAKNAPHPVTFLQNTWQPAPIIEAIMQELANQKRNEKP